MHACMHAFSEEELVVTTSNANHCSQAVVSQAVVTTSHANHVFMYHCLNSLQRSISSLVDFCRHRLLVEGFGRWVFGRWVAMMLLRCAVSDAVSFLPLGVLL